MALLNLVYCGQLFPAAHRVWRSKPCLPASAKRGSRRIRALALAFQSGKASISASAHKAPSKTSSSQSSWPSLPSSLSGAARGSEPDLASTCPKTRHGPRQFSSCRTSGGSPLSLRIASGATAWSARYATIGSSQSCVVATRTSRFIILSSRLTRPASSRRSITPRQSAKGPATSRTASPSAMPGANFTFPAGSLAAISVSTIPDGTGAVAGVVGI